MTQPKLKTTPFDIAEYLDDEEVIAEYLNEAAAADDPAVLLSAIGDVAKARGAASTAPAPCPPDQMSV